MASVENLSGQTIATSSDEALDWGREDSENMLFTAVKRERERGVCCIVCWEFCCISFFKEERERESVCWVGKDFCLSACGKHGCEKFGLLFSFILE